MASIYRAVVDGEHIRWIDRPPVLSGEVEVRVTLVESGAGAASRRALVLDALTRLAERGGIEGIDDAAAWQRQVRSDRPLPGRQP